MAKKVLCYLTGEEIPSKSKLVHIAEVTISINTTSGPIDSKVPGFYYEVLESREEKALKEVKSDAAETSKVVIEKMKRARKNTKGYAERMASSS